MSVFEVPASKASIKQNQFEFKIPGEKKARSLPLLKYTPIGYRNRLAELSKPIAAAKEVDEDPKREDLQKFGELQLEILEKYSPGLADTVDDDQIAAILKQWQEASNITVGESPASAGS